MNLKIKKLLYIKCEYSYIYLLKIFDIQLGIMQCGDDLIFMEKLIVEKIIIQKI